MSGNATYGFVLFFNLLSAINAKKAMDGAKIGGNKIRVRLYMYTVLYYLTQVFYFLVLYPNVYYILPFLCLQIGWIW